DGALARAGLEVQLEVLPGLELGLGLEGEAGARDVADAPGLPARLEPERGPEVDGAPLLLPTLAAGAHVTPAPLKRAESAEAGPAAEGIHVDETGQALEEALAGYALGFLAATTGAEGLRHGHRVQSLTERPSRR